MLLTIRLLVLMEILTVLKTALIMVLMLSAPPLITAVVSGVLISLVQTLVQVQDQTLPFSVKLICVAAILAATGGWIGSELISLSDIVFSQIQRV